MQKDRASLDFLLNIPMIKPINISLLNTSKELYYKCANGHSGTIFLENRLINVDSEYNAIEELSGYECPDCGLAL